MRFLLAFAICVSVAHSALAAPAKSSVKTERKAPAKNSTATADINVQLSRAIAAGDALSIARLMKGGARPNSEALQRALYGANLAMWKALFDGGLNVNTIVEWREDADYGESLPLIAAVAQSAAADESPAAVALLRLLIARGADLNARGHKGKSALWVALHPNSDSNGSGLVARMLLDAGAKVSPEDAWLLASAARIANPDLLVRALELGVSATSKSAQQAHLLQNALDLRRFTDETGPFNSNAPSPVQAANPRRASVVAILLDAGVAPNDLDGQGQTPLMLAADGGLRPALVELLLKHGAAPNLRREGGPMIWEYAAPTRLFTARQIEDGLTYTDEAFGLVPVDRNSFRAPSAAEVVARQKPEDTRTLELLLDAGTPLEARDSRGQTIMMLAAQSNRAAIIAFLVARGADVFAADKSGDTALHLAAGTDSPAAIGALIDAGADLEARDQRGLTPLLMAAGAGVAGVTSYGPLSITVEGYSGGPEALRALVTRKADPNARGDKGAMALHYVAKQGDTKSAQLLVKSGADINALGTKGVTALHIAVREGDYSMAKLLLQLGADTTIKAAGLTPLALARQPYVTKVNVVGEDPKPPSRETSEMLARLQKGDRAITLRRRQIAELLERSKP